MIKRKIGNQPLNLSEAQIRYAMENTSSAKAAARWLNIDYNTFKRYARMYVDLETGKNLLELQKSKRLKELWELRITGKLGKRPMRPLTSAPLQEIFDGKHPNYDRKKLVSRCLHEGLLVECCENCGYNTRREFDFRIPLKLWYRDNNKNNLALENLRLLCFNCYFVLAFPSPFIQEMSAPYIVMPGKQIS